MSTLLHVETCCPWCKSEDRKVTLDVPGLRVHCYNDWHSDLCAHCQRSEYDHDSAHSKCRNFTGWSVQHKQEMGLREGVAP